MTNLESSASQRAPITYQLAEFIAGLQPNTLPAEVIDYTRLLVFDGIGTLYAATHPKVTASSGMATFALAQSQGGPAQSTLIGQEQKIGAVNAVFANGTLGYACDFEPHHPEAILHPIAVMIPTALALSEMQNRNGHEFINAVALGCEISYRVSMAMNPKELYALGFHPSAVCGAFGAAATAAYLLKLDTETTVRTLGLAALQASGLMAWQDDPREDARPFQMGMAARNGVTAALLAQSGFGAPDRIFDGGHNVLHAFSRGANSEPLLAGLGKQWDGVSELAIKPYPCVSFLHPALDALHTLLDENQLKSSDISAIQLRFADSGSHCVDDNPLKGHCAQYVLPVSAACGRLQFVDLFDDRRLSNPEVARLAAATQVIRDFGEFEQKFPDFYIGEISLTLSNGTQLSKRSDIARGYPEAPLSDNDIQQKFSENINAVSADSKQLEAFTQAATTIIDAENLHHLAGLLAHPAIIKRRENNHYPHQIKTHER